MKTTRSLLASSIVVGAALQWTCGAALAQSVNDANLVTTTYLTGLSQPTGLVFSGLGEGFAIERVSGTVKRFQNGVLAPAEVLNLNVNSEGERGLLGIALDPNFATNGYTYLYYSSNNLGAGVDGGTWVDNRVAKYQWNGTSLVSTGVIRTFGTSADGQGNATIHNGGPLTFGADGNLYGVTGDLDRRRTEQNVPTASNGSSNVGGVYRLDTNLNPAAGNPFSGGQAPFYAYGVRNSFGIAVDPVTNNVWDTENGPDVYDEINLLSSGMNSGWTAIMGPNSRDPQNVSDLVALPGSTYVDPKFSSLNPLGITALEFLANSAWGPDYQNAVIFGGANGTNAGRLFLLRLNAARDGFVLTGDLADLVADNAAERNALAFGSQFGTVTSMKVGPDGALYVTSFGSGNVYRIAPVPEPETWAILALGLGLMALRLRRGSRHA